MLREHDVEFTYREYRKEPLTEAELRDVVAMLGVRAGDLLRTRDKSVKEAGLSASDPDDVLVPHMAANPTSVQRPIGIKDGKAAIGRPVGNLLEIL